VSAPPTPPPRNAAPPSKWKTKGEIREEEFNKDWEAHWSEVKDKKLARGSRSEDDFVNQAIKRDELTKFRMDWKTARRKAEQTAIGVIE
jgi:hypothetical protein